MVSGDKLGALVGKGRTSRVYAWGTDSVVKVPLAAVPDEWAHYEAQLTRAVHAIDVPTPEVRDLVTIDGRQAVVFERIDGQSMWQQMVGSPHDAAALARELAAIQLAVLAAGIPPNVPDLVDRTHRKITAAAALSPEERSEAIEVAGQLPRGAALLHGDLHPGNVLMSSRRPVVIDWFDATIGHPVADIARSSLLMRPLTERGSRPHLPDATPELVALVHDAFVSDLTPHITATDDELIGWQTVAVASRLSEQAEAGDAELLALWQARTQRPPPFAMSALSGRSIR